jgi:hypothetical protein
MIQWASENGELTHEANEAYEEISRRKTMTECRECGKPIFGTARKEFCDDYCRGDYHRRKYRQQAVEEAEDRLANGHGGTPQERQKASEEARVVIEQMVAKAGPKIVRRI